MSVGPTPSNKRGAAFAPLREGAFRDMWLAQFASNVGSWMQTVGAQWLMLSLTTSAVPVALIQTASSLPVLLFAVPAGAVGDLVDRRRLILWTQAAMLLAAAALGALTLAGLATPWLILALVFALGSGQALNSPTWQTLQPELVPAAERSQAIALGSVNQNLARAIGPAIGGLLIVVTSAGWVFVVNAVTFVAVLAVVFRWQDRTRAVNTLPAEHAGPAIRAGGRYVANSPVLRAVLVRAGAFVFFASALWALLPLTAHSRLHLGSGGYGLLLGAVGLGAVGGAVALPRLRARCSTDAMVGGASVVLGGVALVLAWVHVAVVVGVALAVGGLAWILVLATLNSAYQASLPNWVKARAMGWYLIIFQGGNALGSAVLGIGAQQAGLTTTLVIAAAGLVLGPLAAIRYPLRPIDPQQLLPAGDWPAPQALDTDTDALSRGPVLVRIEYHPQPGREAELLAALSELRYSRRRTGASSWRVWRELEPPGLYVETFMLASWDDHLRQHDRFTVADRARQQRVLDLVDPDRAPVVTHLIAARTTIPHHRPTPVAIADPNPSSHQPAANGPSHDGDPAA
jgi:MFS family permease